MFSGNACCVGIKYLNSLPLHQTSRGNVKAQSEVAFRMANDLACVCVCFIAILNIHAKPEKLRPSGDTSGI